MFEPTTKELALFHSLCVSEFTGMSLPCFLSGRKLSPEELADLARLRAAFQFFRQAGAIDEKWVAKRDERSRPVPPRRLLPMVGESVCFGVSVEVQPSKE